MNSGYSCAVYSYTIGVFEDAVSRAVQTSALLICVCPEDAAVYLPVLAYRWTANGLVRIITKF